MKQHNQHINFEREPQAKQYDLIVLGSGPGGQRAAIQAAKLGKKVLVIEKQKMGGACLHLGTIPSKALREASLSCVPDTTSLRAVKARAKRVIDEECAIIEEQLGRNHVEFISAAGSFVDDHHVSVENAVGKFTVRGDVIVIAVGTRPRRPSEYNFDGETLFDSDSILTLEKQPSNLLVLGAGVIGCEYASIFARMGIQVTLVENRPSLLPSIDKEIVTALSQQFETSGITVRLATQYKDLKSVPGPSGRRVASIQLFDAQKSDTLQFDAVLYCLGRSGNHEELNLPAIGIKADDRGNLAVNKNYQTEKPHIYAVGDIIGSPALAASSSEQGRLAALHAFTGKMAEFPDTFPYGIYTIPEISTVGFQEEHLAKRGIKYVIGKARYNELARGKMINDEYGFLKLVVHAKTRRLVGIHIIGTSATELVHIGQVAMSFGATVDFFVENVFNYPTLAEAYKVAAYNAINQLK